MMLASGRQDLYKVYRVGMRGKALVKNHYNMMESLILAQDERWRRGLGMQVERYGAFGHQRVANG